MPGLSQSFTSLHILSCCGHFETEVREIAVIMETVVAQYVGRALD